VSSNGRACSTKSQVPKKVTEESFLRFLKLRLHHGPNCHQLVVVNYKIRHKNTTIKIGRERKGGKGGCREPLPKGKA
jgi:hypothetical protein